MKLKLIIAATAFLAAATASQVSYAGVVLSDNFDGSKPDQLNWQGDSVFVSTSSPAPSISSAQVGAFDFFFGQGHGSYVDLDGSSGTAMIRQVSLLRSRHSDPANIRLRLIWRAIAEAPLTRRP